MFMEVMDLWHHTYTITIGVGFITGQHIDKNCIPPLGLTESMLNIMVSLIVMGQCLVIRSTNPRAEINKVQH